MVWPTLNAWQNSSKSHKYRCPCLSLKWVPKSTFKTQFQESRQKCISSTLVLPSLHDGRNSSKSHKNRCPCQYFKWVSKLKCTLGYQILISRNLSKVKLHHAVSPRLGLKGVKIAQNMAKVLVHACLSNRHLSLWSNFNSKKLLKIETPSCGFTRIGLKGGQNSSKHCET